MPSPVKCSTSQLAISSSPHRSNARPMSSRAPIGSPNSRPPSSGRDRERQRDEGIGARQRREGENPHPQHRQREIEHDRRREMHVLNEANQPLCHRSVGQIAQRGELEQHLPAGHADRIGDEQRDLRERETVVAHHDGFRSTMRMASNRLSGTPIRLAVVTRRRCRRQARACDAAETRSATTERSSRDDPSAPATSPSPADSRRMLSGVKNHRCCGGVISRHLAPASRAAIDAKSPVVITMMPPGLSCCRHSASVSRGSGRCSITSSRTMTST